MSAPQSAAMLQLINGFHVSRALYVAAKLGLADLVSDGSKSCSELAAATKADASALHRVLRVLASAGVFELTSDQHVTKTELSQTLESDSLGSLRAWATDQLGGEHYLAWGELLHSTMTGHNAFEYVFGKNAWNHRADNPQSAHEFDEGMSSFIGAHNRAILGAYSFADLDILYDLGGGNGLLMETVLSACPHLHGILLEQAQVAQKAKLRFINTNLMSRCEVIEGNIFNSIPFNNTNKKVAYLLARVIHDWCDELALRILKVCRQAMQINDTLLIVDRIMPNIINVNLNTRALATSDLNMLIMTGGCERTKTQFSVLLESSDFIITSWHNTETVLSIIEAKAI